MIDLLSNICNEALLYRYLDDELTTDERSWLTAHLETCLACTSQLRALTSFSEKLRDRVEQATDAVDFTALEKSVLNTALRERYARGGTARLFTSLKYIIPATVTAGLLIFFGYTQFTPQQATGPSAIINSFTGSMSSVMIFETPETRQTILWYNEDTDVESEPNSV